MSATSAAFSVVVVGLPVYRLVVQGVLSEPLFCAVLAGSCSRATLGQIGLARDHVPTLELDALATPDAAALAQQARDWMAGKLDAARPIVIAASSTPERVAALQAKLGRDAAGAHVDDRGPDRGGEQQRGKDAVQDQLGLHLDLGNARDERHRPADDHEGDRQQAA